ncbi:MAG: SufE family protein [Bacteroidales bacterium]|nr:SufE family protein [Bacteroidales bacterium]MBQ2489795.1 SufE family protein [Bacteroidales bacterium]MBQ6667856.1 SufE family protein [Bacteroidales bacterium]MBR4338996.1 SufE family protein [Bacteroidales bacterium]MBR4492999.1 SufE family protein [Bacteroidales bacterium]
MTIKEAEEKIIGEFSYFEDWMDKYNYIIELGKSLPLIDPQYKTDEYRIEGCQSNVWLQAEYRDNRLHFTADSDAIITKGIINLLIRVLSDRTPQEILSADLSYIDAIGLKKHLSPTRSNGLLAMIQQIKRFAIVYQAKSQQDER